MNTLAIQRKIKPLLIEKKGKWTYADFDLLPPEFPCQIINHNLIMSPAPHLFHQDISRDIELLIYGFISKHAEYKGGKLYDAPVDVVLEEGNVFQPDLVFISEKNRKILTDKNIQGAPDLVIEILSPSSIRDDRNDKMVQYAKHKVLEYWIVDPANESVEIYEWTNGKYKLFSFAAGKGAIKSKILKGFKFKIEKVFSKT